MSGKSCQAEKTSIAASSSVKSTKEDMLDSEFVFQVLKDKNWRLKAGGLIQMLKLAQDNAYHRDQKVVWYQPYKDVPATLQNMKKKNQILQSFDIYFPIG